MALQIDTLLKEALRSGDKQRLSVIRLLKTALVNERIKLGAGSILSDEQEQTIIRRELKARFEAATMYDQAGRSVQAAQERAEAAILEEYLPKQLSDDELVALVAKVRSELGDAANFGQLMQASIAAAAGLADGKRISDLLKQPRI